jgi:hypothetical protein
MKFLILCCLIAFVTCDDCNTRTDNDYQQRLIIDFDNNNQRQDECVRNILKNNENIREVDINVGDQTGDQTTDTNGQRLKNLLKACDDDNNNVDRITLNLNNARCDDNNDDCQLNTLKELRFNLRNKDDCDTAQRLLDKITAKDLRSFELFTNSENEVQNALDFAARNCDNLRYIRLNSNQGDFQSDRDKFFLRQRDGDRKIDDQQLNNLKKIRQNQDRQGGERNQLREVDIRCGNDLNQFDFIFRKDNRNFRRIYTNRDLTQLCDDCRYDRVWRLSVRNFDANDDNLSKLNQHFPNCQRFSINSRDQNGLTDTQRDQIKTTFQKTDRRTECRNF